MQKEKVSEQELERESRRAFVSEARAAIAYRSKEELGISGAEIARHLGVNTSSINRALAKMDEFIRKWFVHRRNQRSHPDPHPD